MTSRPSLRLVASLSLALALVTPISTSSRAAPPDPKAVCFEAYPDAQKDRKTGKLRAARRALVTCSQDACPAAVRKDCAQWLAEVDAELPSVLVVATDPSGRDTAAVRVSVDGEIVAERLAGKSIEVDPGEHVFRFEHAGQAIEQSVIVRQSEKSRKLAIDFATPRGSAAPTAPPPPVDGAPPSPSRPVPVAVFVLGGVALASLATGTYFYFAQKSEHDDLAARCAPACSPDDVAPLKTKQLVAGVGLGVGVAALAAATVLFVTRRADGETTALGVAPHASGATLVLARGF